LGYLFIPVSGHADYDADLIIEKASHFEILLKIFKLQDVIRHQMLVAG